MAEQATVYVEVSAELLNELGKWSEPVQVRVVSKAGSILEMEFRKVPREIQFKIPDVGPLDD